MNSDIKRAYQEALSDVAARVGAASAVEHAIEATQSSPAGEFIILSGISGVGKTTIGSRLGERGYQKLRNTYVRPPRAHETEADGIFIDETTFHTWNSEGRFVSTKITNGVWHGLLHSEVERALQGDTLVWADKSVGSVRKLPSTLIDTARLVYLLPPSFDELWERLYKRSQMDGSLSEADIEARLFEEIQELRDTIHLPYTYIVNDHIERVVERLTV